MYLKNLEEKEDCNGSDDAFEKDLMQLFTSVPLGKAEITSEEPLVYKKFELVRGALRAWKKLGPLFLSML